jgi:hypothetical protein
VLGHLTMAEGSTSQRLEAATEVSSSTRDMHGCRYCLYSSFLQRELT